MNDKSCRERVFPLEMASGFENCYLKYVHWLKHLLERLGREPALEIWGEAFAREEDDLLAGLLAIGWGAAAGEPVDVKAHIEARLGASFGLPVEGVTAEEARRIVEGSWPVPQVRRRFSDLNVEHLPRIHRLLCEMAYEKRRSPKVTGDIGFSLLFLTHCGGQNGPQSIVHPVDADVHCTCIVQPQPNQLNT